MRTWVDDSTLIALDAIGEVLVLREVLGRVAITPQVAEEIFVGRESRALREALGSWIETVPVRGDLARWTALGLGTGEASLLQAPERDRLVLDGIPARTVAEAEGRDYVGLLGLLLGGVDRGTLKASRAREILAKLAHSSFRMSTDLYDEVLRRIDARA